MPAAFVNSTAASWSGGSGVTEASTSLTPAASAHLLVVGIVWQTPGSLITGISGNGNTYNLAEAVTDTIGAMSVYYVASCASGATIVSITWGADPGFGAIVVHEASGCNTVTPLDQHILHPQANPGTGTDAYTSTAKTPSTDGQYLFGMTFDESASADTWTKGTGWTSLRQPGIAAYYATEDLVQATAASIAATFTIAANTFERAIVGLATFKAAASGNLFRSNALTGLGAGGPFFRDPLQEI